MNECRTAAFSCGSFNAWLCFFSIKTENSINTNVNTCLCLYLCMWLSDQMKGNNTNYNNNIPLANIMTSNRQIICSCVCARRMSGEKNIRVYLQNETCNLKNAQAKTLHWTGATKDDTTQAIKRERETGRKRVSYFIQMLLGMLVFIVVPRLQHCHCKKIQSNFDDMRLFGKAKRCSCTTVLMFVCASLKIM